MKAFPVPFLMLASISVCLPACHRSRGQQPEAHEEHHTIVVTSVDDQDVVSTQDYVCQIHSRRHIEVCALEGGYLEKINVKEGQKVEKGDVMFEILPVLHKARLDSDMAEANLAEIELQNTQNLYEDHVVSKPEVALAQAKLAKAKANVETARAELNFTDVKAPFDGIIDRQLAQQGSLIEEGDILTTMSDNSVMWVYFNVPEARYLEYQADLDQDGVKARAEDDDDEQGEDDEDDEDDEDNDDDEIRIELVLANGEAFPQPGEIATIEADFNNETGNIAFRADFPNPERLLRHGQTGNVLIHRTLDDALVIPQRATFEVLAKRYVYVVDTDDVVHVREIVVQEELEDIFVIKKGLDATDKIVLDGIRQVRDGEKLEYEFEEPEDVLANLKYHAE